MAAVTIRQGLTSGSPLAETPRDQWGFLMEMRRMFCRRELPGDCRILLRFIEDGRAGGFAGYSDEDTYIRDGLGLDPETVRWAVEGLSIMGAEVPVTFADAVETGRLGTHGGDRRSDKVRDQGSIGNLKGGNNTAYTLARLDRDRPELAAEVRAGRMTANAAAIEAGFRRKPTPFETLTRVWAKASAAERAAFRDFIDAPVMDRRAAE